MHDGAPPIHPPPAPAHGAAATLGLSTAMEHMHDGMVLVDARARGLPVVSFNPAFERITGFGRSEVIGRNCAFLQGSDGDQPGPAILREAIAGCRPVDTVLRNYRKDGRLFLNHLRIAPVMDDGGAVSHFVGIQRDVTEEVRLRARLQGRNAKLRAAVRHLKAASLTDALTGLGNRRAFSARLAGAWAEATRSGQPLTLFMVDVDWFKNYNDHHGHPAGDATLQKVAAVLGNTMRRGTDFAARHGGEEFALLGHGMPPRRAAVVAAKLCRRVHRLRLLHGASPLGRVTVSVGHATAWPRPGLAPAALMKLADAALYRAKHSGRNQAAAASASASDSASAPTAPGLLLAA